MIIIITISIEKIFNKPMDIEGVIKDNRVYVVQARPITTLGGKYDGRKSFVSDGLY